MTLYLLILCNSVTFLFVFRTANCCYYLRLRINTLIKLHICRDIEIFPPEALSITEKTFFINNQRENLMYKKILFFILEWVRFQHWTVSVALQNALACLSKQIFNNTKVKEEPLSVWQEPLPCNQLNGRCVA